MRILGSRCRRQSCRARAGLEAAQSHAPKAANPQFSRLLTFLLKIRARRRGLFLGHEGGQFVTQAIFELLELELFWAVATWQAGDVERGGGCRLELRLR